MGNLILTCHPRRLLRDWQENLKRNVSRSTHFYYNEIIFTPDLPERMTPDAPRVD
jgi:hypothetical protein